MKILFFFAIQLFFLTLPSYAVGEEKAAQVKTFYIKISGHGSSFSIAPSMHSQFEIPFPQFYAFAIAKQIGAAKGLCLEADAVTTKEDILAGKYAQKMIIYDDFNVLRYIDDSKKLLILSNSANLTSQQAQIYFSHATPFAIQQDVMPKLTNVKFFSPPLDSYFIEFAKLKKVPIHYLETSSEGAEQIIRTFSDVKGWQTSLLKLTDFLECEDCKKAYELHLLDMEEAFFLRGDFKQAQFHFNEIERLAGIDKPMGVVHGDKRSLYLLEKILTRANSNECNVFAIGAAHFWGEHSLQEELKKRGYDVEMVSVVSE